MNSMVVIFRLVLASILGGIVGIERQTKHRPAGFRTHVLVCMGSALIMCLSEHMFIKYHTLYGITGDPARLGSQVISGIGFLGAGTIVHFGTSVKGLTTAASLWVVACVGLSVGAGFYTGATSVTVIIFITLIALNKLALKIDEASNNLELMIAFHNKPKIFGSILILLGDMQIKVLDLEYINDDMTAADDYIRTIRLALQLQKHASVFDTLESISKINGIVKVERI